MSLIQLGNKIERLTSIRILWTNFNYSLCLICCLIPSFSFNSEVFESKKIRDPNVKSPKKWMRFFDFQMNNEKHFHNVAEHFVCLEKWGVFYSSSKAREQSHLTIQGCLWDHGLKNVMIIEFLHKSELNSWISSEFELNKTMTFLELLLKFFSCPNWRHSQNVYLIEERVNFESNSL